MPFIESANYLGMNYLGDIHTYIENDTINDEVKNRLHHFVETIKKAI
jgi:hypothetical protein